MTVANVKKNKKKPNNTWDKAFFASVLPDKKQWARSIWEDERVMQALIRKQLGGGCFENLIVQKSWSQGKETLLFVKLCIYMTY